MLFNCSEAETSEVCMCSVLNLRDFGFFCSRFGCVSVSHSAFIGPAVLARVSGEIAGLDDVYNRMKSRLFCFCERLPAFTTVLNVREESKV